MNPDPGGLTVHVDDRATSITMTGGGEWVVPTGPVDLVETALERAVRPGPAQLTNALGVVQDHFDDVLREAPTVEACPSIAFTGVHALELAYVEIGARALPEGYVLHRADADEVFRTLVAEPVDERLHNPGLDPDHGETIIGTCCVVLAMLRRLDLQGAAILPVTARPGGT